MCNAVLLVLLQPIALYCFGAMARHSVFETPSWVLLLTDILSVWRLIRNSSLFLLCLAYSVNYDECLILCIRVIEFTSFHFVLGCISWSCHLALLPPAIPSHSPSQSGRILLWLYECLQSVFFIHFFCYW